MEVINTIGRRKTATARAYLSKGKGKITVNGRDYKDYFPQYELKNKLRFPLEATETLSKISINANVSGGGVKGQAEALSLAISRGLCEYDEENRGKLKPFGFLTRDSRMVERKKPGRKKARKSFQFSKR